MFVSVSRINNPKSENDKKWVVSVGEGYMKPMETVFMHEKKSECVKYAKNLADKPIVSNGIEYGCAW